MPLVLRQVEEADFNEMAKLNDVEDDGLVAPLLLAIWHADADRNQWSLNQQREIFLNDPTATFLTVVDTDRGNGSGEMLALARWHYYPNGYKHPDMTAAELRAKSAEGEKQPAGLNEALLEALLLPLCEVRESWMGNQPQWVLTTLVTRSSQRRRGAGGMLVKWGVDKAREEGVPAYLEATPAGKPLYEKFGFRQVQETKTDLSSFGIPEPIACTQMAVYPPAKKP